MPPAKPQDERNSRQVALLEAVWSQIRGHLENQKQRIGEEIKHYPRPIPACDLQFNALLEERARVSQEVDRLHEAVEESLQGRDALQLLEEFLRSSSYLDAEAKQRITLDLQEGLSKLDT